MSIFLIDDVFARVTSGLGTPADAREIKRRLCDAKMPRWVVNAVLRPDRRLSMLRHVIAEGVCTEKIIRFDSVMILASVVNDVRVDPPAPGSPGNAVPVQAGA